jgi:stalled ribosome alternative rescue factor ArfA
VRVLKLNDAVVRRKKESDTNGKGSYANLNKHPCVRDDYTVPA